MAETAAFEPARFSPTGGAPANAFWEPVIVSGDQLREEAHRLLDLDVADPLERQTRIVHPMADERGLGFAPGIEVRLSALRPGERTAPFRHNAAEVGFCIEGSGQVEIGAERFALERYDVWNQTSWTSVVHHNTGSAPQIRLTYSNAPLLRMLNVHLVDETPPASGRAEPTRAGHVAGAAASPEMPPDLFQMDDNGPWLMRYERLINPPNIRSDPHHWPWAKVRSELDKLTALGAAYKGRRLYLLYNPMTGRSNGTTPGFFATMTVRPPSIVDRPHRHVSAAINYYFSGAGYSRVAGKHYEWKAGDLMLSAPGWAIHNHASHDQGPVYELTVQDQPFHIMQESLLWQESLAEPAALLGARPGFATNRAEVEAARIEPA